MTNPPIAKLPVCEAAAFLGVSRSWLNKRRVDGFGPPYLKLGRRVLYDLDDLNRWVSRNRRQNTSQPV